jgi:hypothetical protein
MRLLDTATLQLKEFIDDEQPRKMGYAILSHRWEDEEVLFADVQSGQAKSRKGYAKLQGCCRIAREDGFRWVWIDTCCIDKSSSAELSEAINSMFRWYENASVCYAYLSDVQATTFSASATATAKNPLESPSAWFYRGWTLQELLAPEEVVFYSREWIELGTKRTLSDALVRWTFIDPLALSKRRQLKSFSVAQRMSWAAKRKTTRLEDEAYSLLGLFDINMPLLYGEGRRAFARLQEQILARTNDMSILAWTNASDEIGFVDELTDIKGHFVSLLARGTHNFNPVVCTTIEKSYSNLLNGRNRQILKTIGEDEALTSKFSKPFHRAPSMVSDLSAFEISGPFLAVTSLVAYGSWSFGPLTQESDPSTQLVLRWVNRGFEDTTALFFYPKASAVEDADYASKALLLISGHRSQKYPIAIILERDYGAPNIWKRCEYGLVCLTLAQLGGLGLREDRLLFNLHPPLSASNQLLKSIRAQEARTCIFRAFPGREEGYASCRVYVFNNGRFLRDYFAFDAVAEASRQYSGLPSRFSTGDVFEYSFFNKYRRRDPPESGKTIGLLFPAIAHRHRKEAPPFLLAFRFGINPSDGTTASDTDPEVMVGLQQLTTETASHIESTDDLLPPLSTAPWRFPLLNKSGSSGSDIFIKIRRGPGSSYSVAIRLVKVSL